MFVTLTFTYGGAERTFKVRTINADDIGSIENAHWMEGSTQVNGSKIVWRDRDRPHAFVTATRGDIARALGAEDLG